MLVLVGQRMRSARHDADVVPRRGRRGDRRAGDAARDQYGGPLGDLTVNLGGSFVLGLLIGADAATVPVAIGGVGTLTTWSGVLTGLLERVTAFRASCSTCWSASAVVSVLAWAGLQLGG